MVSHGWRDAPIVMLICTSLSIFLFKNKLSSQSFDSDNYLNGNPWKIHEEFGLLIEDIAAIFSNPRHPRPKVQWKANQTQNFGLNRNLTNQKISVANGLFVQNGYSIREDYRDAILNTYKSTIYSLDFAQNARGSSQFINRWDKQARTCSFMR